MYIIHYNQYSMLAVLQANKGSNRCASNMSLIHTMKFFEFLLDVGDLTCNAKGIILQKILT
jgi:hypothetical protein